MVKIDFIKGTQGVDVILEIQEELKKSGIVEENNYSEQFVKVKHDFSITITKKNQSKIKNTKNGVIETW